MTNDENLKKPWDHIYSPAELLLAYAIRRNRRA